MNPKSRLLSTLSSLAVGLSVSVGEANAQDALDQDLLDRCRLVLESTEATTATVPTSGTENLLPPDEKNCVPLLTELKLTGPRIY